MKIEAQEIDRIGKSFLTMRADGRYLGTLFCTEAERDVLIEMLEYGAGDLPDAPHTFAHTERLK